MRTEGSRIPFGWIRISLPYEWEAKERVHDEPSSDAERPPDTCEWEVWMEGVNEACVRGVHGKCAWVVWMGVWIGRYGFGVTEA